MKHFLFFFKSWIKQFEYLLCSGAENTSEYNTISAFVELGFFFFYGAETNI